MKQDDRSETTPEPRRLLESGQLAPLLHEYRKRTQPRENSEPAAWRALSPHLRRRPPGTGPRPDPRLGSPLARTLVGGLLAAAVGVWLLLSPPSGTTAPSGVGGSDGASGAGLGSGGARGSRGARGV